MLKKANYPPGALSSRNYHQFQF